MKKLVTTTRILLGLIFTVFGLDFFLHFMPAGAVSEAGGAYLEALFNTGYMFPVIKSIELGAGLLLLTGYRPQLGLALLAPITFNIALYHLFLDPNGIILGMLVAALEVFLLWAYRDAFKSLFQATKVHAEPVRTGAALEARPLGIEPGATLS